jgi:hypothetical protein
MKKLQTIRRFFLMRPFWLSLLALALYGGLAMGSRAYFPPPTPQLIGAASAQGSGEEAKKAEAKDEKDERPIPWSSYHEALKTERELLAQHVDRQERWLLGVGAVLIGLIVFLFGQTRRDVVAQLREDIRERTRDEVEREVKLQFAAEIKKTIGDYIEAHYKTQPIRWVAAEDSDTAREVMQALQKLKFNNVQRVEPGKLEGLAGARLVIFSYGKIMPAKGADGKTHDLTDKEKTINKQALAELRDIAAWARNQPVPTPLVIHSESNNALQKEEKVALQGTVNVPANFPSTVITHTLTLLHR